jgi:hypothetical protein
LGQAVTVFLLRVSARLPGTTEGGSCTPPQHSTRHVTSGTIPHHTPVASRGSALLRVIRPWPVTQDWTGRTSQATGRNVQTAAAEKPKRTRLRLRYDRACPARATELRPPLSAPQQTRRQPAAQGKLPSRVGILSAARGAGSTKAGVATKVRLDLQRRGLKPSASPSPSSHFPHVKTRTIFAAFLALGR